jgi:glycosyltransferase involved in cell wall biosynthesis
VTVGFYSPLPPARTGVADYAAALLAGLQKLGRVEVAPAACDVALYHLGNNRLHSEIYQHALEKPGVVVLHDAVLHHFLLGTLEESAYVDEFVYNYGEWSRGLARELWRGRPSSGSDRRYFDYPMLKRIVERSRAVVVHNPAAARVVAEHSATARVVEIPHLFVASPYSAGGADSIRWRQSHGIDPGNFLFGVFGYLRESKRLVAVLDAFSKVHREFPRTNLLVAGDFVSSDLERAVRPMLEGTGVVRLPHLDEREFWLAAGTVDACINLRYPAAGETSGIAIRLMGLGKPVMMTDAPECSRFPDDACVRIAAGAAERESLIDHMRLAAGMPEVSGAIGERAAAHIRAHHGVEQVAALYWEVLTVAGRDR